ncbi:MAG TPA: peptidylprolyl isomerase [bacterium]
MREWMRWGAAVAATAMMAWSPAGAAAEQAAAAQGAAPAAAGTPVAAATPMARVNGAVITRGDFERNLAFVVQGGGTEGEEAPAAATDEVRAQVLDRLIDEELLHQEARKRNLLATPAAVDAEIEQARAQFETAEAFAAALAKGGLDTESLRALVSRNLSIQRLVEEGVAAGVTVSDAEVHAFYAGNAESFAIPEQVRARHILVQFGENDDAVAKAAKRAKAEGLLAQIKGGASFEDLAKANSDCPSAPEGGDLGFFERGQMVPAFDDVAFALKPGEVSGVVETEFGYDIIRVEERKAAGTIAEKDATAQITEYLKAQKTEGAVEALVKELRAAAKIEKLS